MNCKKHTTQNKHESGSTTVEALMAVVILFMIAFAMIQVYHWCITKQFCQYSAFYTSKSLALGYRDDVALRAARVAAIAISGITWVPKSLSQTILYFIEKVPSQSKARRKLPSAFCARVTQSFAMSRAISMYFCSSSSLPIIPFRMPKEARPIMAFRERLQLWAR